MERTDTTEMTEQEVQDRCRRRWQREFRNILREPVVAPPLRFMRRRLDRWRMGALPGHRPQRALRIFQALTGKVPPRVLAALLRTLFNGRCAGRRLQRPAQCMFRCGGDGPIEHHARRGCVRQFASSMLALLVAADQVEELLRLSGSNGVAVEVLVRRAARATAVYKIRCAIRHSSCEAPRQRPWWCR